MSTSDDPTRPAESDRPEVRIGDREREAAVAHLGRAFGEGRLDLAEYDERVASAYTAKTASDLLHLTGDLPLARVWPAGSTAPGEGEQLSAINPNPVRGMREYADDRPTWIRRLWGTYATVVALSFVIWLVVGITGKGGFPYPWPLWVAGPWGALLLFQTIGGMPGRRGSGEASR